MKKIELLAPAGDPEKLRIALAYGADSVYLGGEDFGLRASAGNFNVTELREATAYTHAFGKKLYLTLNSFPHPEEMDILSAYLQEIAAIPLDGFLVSDPGVLTLLKKHIPKGEIHISTQANVTNGDAANFWHEMGASRIVLARELSLEEIRNVRRDTPISLELEAFVHGAMCMSYSGRCLLSNFMTGRDANRGACAHPCRYKYRLEEEKRPGEYFPIEEDERGSYIMNSNDLNMLPYLPELVDSGLDCLKIEGRAKSVFYVASVVSAYRNAIDAYYANPQEFHIETDWMKALDRPSHRLYSTGFYFEKPTASSQNYTTSQYFREATFLGIVLDYDPKNATALVEQRNKIHVGDTVEFFGPGGMSFSQRIDAMSDEEGMAIPAAPHPKQRVRIPVVHPVGANDMVCRWN